MSKICSPLTFTYCNPNSQYFRIELCLETSLWEMTELNDVVVGWALIQCGWNFKEEMSPQTPTEGWACEDAGEDSRLQSKARGPEEINPSDTLIWDFQLTTVEKIINFHCFNHPVSGTLLWRPQELIQAQSLDGAWIPLWSWRQRVYVGFGFAYPLPQWLREWAGKLSQYPSSPGWVAALR